MIARRWGAALVAALALGLAGCGDGGPVSLPEITSRPSLSLPSRAPTESRPPETAEPTATVEQPSAEPTVTVVETATVTETATATATATYQQSEPAREQDGSGTLTTWWPLVVAALVLLGVCVFLWQRSRARSDWDQRFVAARRDLSWMEGSLVAQLLAKATPAEAVALWYSAQPRLLSIDEELHALEGAAVGAERTARAAQARVLLGALCDAAGADTFAGSSADAGQLRIRRAAVEQARSEMRAWLEAQEKE